MGGRSNLGSVRAEVYFEEIDLQEAREVRTMDKEEARRVAAVMEREKWIVAVYVIENMVTHAYHVIADKTNTRIPLMVKSAREWARIKRAHPEPD